MSLLVSSGGGGLITASDITDSSASGRTVLTGTASAARTAIGFGGTVTVAQLNDAGADARSALYYCSDCLTVNGPGSLVAWCSRTLTWRTLDDCLLATTDFGEWAADFVKNSNSSEIRGRFGALFCVVGPQSNTVVVSASGGSSQIGAESARPEYGERLNSGATANNGLARHYSAPLVYYSTGRKPKVFSGLKANMLSVVGTGFTFRVGIATSAAPSNTLATVEYSLCYDVGNVLGALNAGAAAQWLACVRSGGVNLAGSGPVGVAPTAGVKSNILLVRDADTISVLIDDTTVASSTATENDVTAIIPFCCIANDGTSTVGATARNLGFCFGYYLP